jgi:HNH endonuclease/AP2 domain
VVKKAPGITIRPEFGVRIRIGQQAGYQVCGRYRIGINGKKYSGSRLAILYQEGWMPPDDVDHKDRNPSNDQWDNLRPCPHGKNMWNIGKHKDNTSGYKGVSWDKRRQKWRARGNVSGKGCCISATVVAPLPYSFSGIALWRIYAKFRTSCKQKRGII